MLKEAYLDDSLLIFKVSDKLFDESTDNLS
jgi:hypothetical protein